MITLIELTKLEQQKIHGGKCCYCNPCNLYSSVCDGPLVGQYDYEVYCARICVDLGYEHHSFYSNPDRVCQGNCQTLCRAKDLIAPGFGIADVCMPDCIVKCACAPYG